MFDVQTISYMVEYRHAEGDGWQGLCRDLPGIGHATVQLPVRLALLDLTKTAVSNNGDLRACKTLTAMVEEVWWETVFEAFEANA